MKIEKCKYFSWFYYHNCKTHLLHGLYNWNDEVIGYCYQENRKGFWLIDNIYLI